METNEDQDRVVTEHEIIIEEALSGRIAEPKLATDLPQVKAAKPIWATNSPTKDEAVVTYQPVGLKFRPKTFLEIPPGLEILLEFNELVIHQDLVIVEAITCWDTLNKYRITNNRGEKIYSALEDSDTCLRQCCSSQKAFVIHVTNNLGEEVIRLKREYRCCSGCGWCADSERFGCQIEVEAPVDHTYGYVCQLKSACRPRYAIQDADQNDLFYMQGPTCVCCGLCNIFEPTEYTISTTDDQKEVAVISKQWSNIVQELCSDADSFKTIFSCEQAPLSPRFSVAYDLESVCGGSNRNVLGWSCQGPRCSLIAILGAHIYEYGN